MSRFKRFAHALLSGYVLLGANMVYTLASVPLALHYLSKAQFGLWALVTQVAGYVALVDFGLSASASRVLIDHKDQRASGNYGSMVQTGALVGLTQAGRFSASLYNGMTTVSSWSFLISIFTILPLAFSSPNGFQLHD